MDIHRKITLVFIVIIGVGILYISGGFIYAALDKIYGPAKDVKMVQCDFADELLKSMERSCDAVKEACGIKMDNPN
jgi:hypothetical protein